VSWSLRKPNVQLRVTKFKPLSTSNEMRTALAAHREKRANETRKVVVAVELNSR
jgi:hypothetical protein